MEVKPVQFQRSLENILFSLIIIFSKEFMKPLEQACQTQTISRVANATKTDKTGKSAQKVLSGPNFTKYND
jgi:hypothetical protein